MPMMFRGYRDQSTQTPPFLPQDDPMGVGGMAAPEKAGFFDRGGMGVNILGGIADAVATGFGGAPVFENRQREVRQRAYEDARLNKPVVQPTGNGGFAVINPVTGEVLNQQAGVRAPTALQQNYEYLKGLDPALGETYIHNQANPMQGIETTDPATGQRSIQFVPRGGPAASSGPSGPPAAAVDYLRKNPALSAQFDQKYGAGASQRILQGGAPSQGGATFR